MRTTVVNRRNRSRRTVSRAAATVLATVLAGGTVLLSAPAALADDGALLGAKLKVDAPAVIGLAGQPVEFTETVTNTGSQEAGYHLYLKAVTGAGLPGNNAVVLDYRDPADGAWKPVPLSAGGEGDDLAYWGEVPYSLEIPAHGSATVRLRLGVPMGGPHEGASNGGIQSMAFESTVGIGAGGAAAARVTDTIKVTGLSSGLSHVPATAVAGGSPVEFDAVLKNPTPSRYLNVSEVLFAGTHATVEVRKANGEWTTVPQVSGTFGADSPGAYLKERDFGVGAKSTTTLRVRVSFDAVTPLGSVKMTSVLLVNESPTAPFSGTSMGGGDATVQIVAPDASAPKAQPAVQETPTAKGASAGKGAVAAKGVSVGKEASAGKGASAGKAPAAAPVAEAAPAAAPAAPAVPVEAPAPAPPAPAPAAPVAAAPATVELAETGSSGSLAAALAAGLTVLGIGGGATFWMARRRL
ncbi:hypothetical protein [Kitasatospora sp. NPDC056184]|uniref:hypothetical protein n=1 Tax=Kitasatospora sp. NPDC056184 TaxID=3345738 RepID=UPI0035D8FB75